MSTGTAGDQTKTIPDQYVCCVRSTLGAKKEESMSRLQHASRLCATQCPVHLFVTSSQRPSITQVMLCLMLLMSQAADRQM
jgi:hypothetical protein